MFSELYIRLGFPARNSAKFKQAKYKKLIVQRWRPLAATTEEVPRPYGRGTSSVVSFVVAIVAMNRVDVVDLVVDLVDVDLDVDLVDVDLDVDLVDVDLDVVPFC